MAYPPTVARGGGRVLSRHSRNEEIGKPVIPNLGEAMSWVAVYLSVTALDTDTPSCNAWASSDTLQARCYSFI